MAQGKRSIKKEKNGLRFLIIILVVVIVATIIGFLFHEVVGSKSNNLLDGYSLYKAANYTVQYNSDWTSAVDKTNPDMIVFTSPDSLGIINVVTEQLSTKYNLDQYVDSFISLLKSNYNLVTSDIGKEKISINGVSAYRISYNANEITRITQTIFLLNSTAYAISYNSADNYFDVYHNMENTLVMK